MLLEERRQSQSCQNILSLSSRASLAQKPLVEEFERFLGEVGLLQQIF